jgi:hypothetical protein
MEDTKHKHFIHERINTEMCLPQDIIDFHGLFKKAGFHLYIVGGQLRDHILGLNSHDIDMVSNASPEKIMEILKDYRRDLQGLHFGVVRVFTETNHLGYEIASYRKDLVSGRNTKGTDKKVETGNHISIKDDMSRRNLTINALYYNIETHEIIDSVGGIEDLKNKIIRAVGIPYQRFNEDRLRILLCIKMSAVLNFTIEEHTSAAIMNDNRLFGVSAEEDVSKERIFLEFIKVKEKAIANNDTFMIKRFIDLLIDYDIMKQIFPVLVTEKNVSPTLYLSVALAQSLKNNVIDTVFKNTLMEAKIPVKYIDTISVLIDILNNGVNPDYVYNLYREIKSKEIDLNIIKDWIKINGIHDPYVLSLLVYIPTTGGDEVMKDGFRKAEIGEEIRRREKEKFIKLAKGIDENYINNYIH